MTTLQPGDPVPPFSAVAADGRTVGEKDLTAGRFIVYFYPRAFTPGCTTESCDFRDRSSRLAGAGYRIIGVSPDEPETLVRFAEEHGLGFELWSDPEHRMSEAFGAWGIKKNYGREYEGLIRSTFVIEDGVVRQAMYNVKATGHADRVVRAVAGPA